MSKKKKRTVALIVAVIIVIIAALLFGIKNENIIGIWVREEEISVEFFEEGAWVCEEDFEGLGGTWKLRSGKIVMEDLLGNTFETAIEKDAKGEYIILQGEAYYKKGNNYNYVNIIDRD